MPTDIPAAGAQIIAFPSRPCSDTQRLERALRDLDQALRGQLRAVQQWRDANAELAGSLRSLTAGFVDLNAALGRSMA